MQEKIKQDGLRGIKQSVIDNLEKALSFIHDNLKYPCIVKPLDSAGTEGVSFCRDDSEVEKAIQRFLGAKNVFGIENKQMLVQE